MSLKCTGPIISVNKAAFSIKMIQNQCLWGFAKCSLASTGLLCEKWNSTLGIRHSQFAYTIGGSILWSASVSRGGAESLFLFRFMDSLESFFFPLSLLSETIRHNITKTDCQLFLAAPKQFKQSNYSLHWCCSLKSLHLQELCSGKCKRF